MADSLHSGRIYVTARLLSQPCEKEKSRQFTQWQPVREGRALKRAIHRRLGAILFITHGTLVAQTGVLLCCVIGVYVIRCALTSDSI